MKVPGARGTSSKERAIRFCACGRGCEGEQSGEQGEQGARGSWCQSFGMERGADRGPLRDALAERLQPRPAREIEMEDSRPAEDDEEIGVGDAEAVADQPGPEAELMPST